MYKMFNFLGRPEQSYSAPRKNKPRRLGLEKLETRSVLTAEASFETYSVTPYSTANDATGQYANYGPVNSLTTPSSSTIASKMVNFLERNLGKRIGSGECAVVATESLRVAGGQFVRTKPDFPNAEDYVWGDFVKRVEFKSGKAVDSNVSAKVKPGDIIQYRNATFSNGKRATHHTSVVASVDSNGNPIQVYEQNIGKLSKTGSTQDRTVRKSSIDLKALNGGWVRIYRPVPKTVSPGRYEFTIVNNTSSSQTLKQYIGSKQMNSTISLDKANTAKSSSTRVITTSGTTRPTIVLAGRSYTITDGVGVEIYSTTSGPRLRTLA